jgi:branched-chain amino acid transport system permease protein
VPHVEIASLWQYVLAGVVSGAIYALIAAGFVLIYQVTGLINFAQGEFAMIGAMTAASLNAAGLPVIAAAVIAVIVAAVVGGLCHVLAIRPARKASGVTLIFITLGLSVAIRGAALFVWGTNPYSLPAFSSGNAITVFGGVLPPQAAWVLLADAIVFAALYLFFRYTYMGTAVRAAVASPAIASTFGIPLRTFAFWSFVVAAAIGGLGGVVVTPITSATYDMGLTLGLAGFVAAVLGGLESLPGALVGGFVLGVVEKVSGGLFSTGWEQGVGFLILVLVLVFRPQGLLGKASRRA